MPDGVHHLDSSLVHASKAANVVVASAAAPPPEDSTLHGSNLPFLYPYRAAPASGSAGAAAGETVDHFQDKDTTRSCSSPRGRNNNNSSERNNNGESMKCLSAIEYNMKANERYFLLNKNTFQEIFDATLYEMTGAAAPVTRRSEVSAQPKEGKDGESIPLRSGSSQNHCRRSNDWTPECGGVYATESSGKKSADVNNGTRKNDLFFCQTTQQDSEPTPQHKISASPGMLCTETNAVERGALGIFSNRMTALNDITNDHHHSGITTNNRNIPTATQSTAPSHFLPPMSPLDIESENEPLDLSVCRRASKSSSVDGRSQSSSDESSAPGSPINLAKSDNHPRSGEVQNTFTATSASEGNDRKSLSDSDEDEEIDPEVVSTNSTCASVGNGDGSTYLRGSTIETSVVGKHSASDERAAGRPDCCWQPTTNAPNEPSCHHQPRGATGATTNTKQARSIDDEIPARSSVDTTIEQDVGLTKRKDSKSAMTGGSGGMATPRMKPRATENWAALSKATVYNLVEEMVLKMDEEENSEASRSPPTPSRVKKNDNFMSDKDSSVSDNGSGNSRPCSRQQMNETPPSTSFGASTPGKTAGRQRYNNNNLTSNSVMQSYDQSLSPAPQLSTSQQSPKSVPAPNLPQLVKPGAKPEENPRAPAEELDTPPQADKNSPEHVKQCWVALNKMVVFDIVETAIRSEAKENNNNITDSGQDESRSTTPDSVSSRYTARSVDDVGSDSRKAALSGCESQNSSDKSRKRKCDSYSAPANTSVPSSSVKCVEQTSKDFSFNFERVSMNESCAVPKRPRSSDCASGDISTDMVPAKQRRKSAEINRSYSAETYFEGNRQTDNPFTARSWTKEGNDQARKQAKESRSGTSGREWESLPSSRQAHGPPHYKSVTAGQSARGGQRSDVTGDKKMSKLRGTPSPTNSNDVTKRNVTSLSSQHSGGSSVHDPPTNNVSSITHLVQSQRTTIDYGRNEILAAKQAQASSTKLGLHSTTSPAHQAPAAIRSRCGVSVNNQYALNDTRDNNGDREIRRKRTKVDSSTTANYEPLTSARSAGGLDGGNVVSLFSTNERDARSSPRLGWIAVSKIDVHNLFSSVVDSMMAEEEERESYEKSRQGGKCVDKAPSESPSASPAPPGRRPASPSDSIVSSIGTNSTVSSPQRQQVDCENRPNRVENEPTGPCSPPSPSSKASCIRTQSPSSSSDNLDSEHMIVDPGSPGDMFLDGEGKDCKSNKKTFKWKSSLLMRVHEESQTTPYDNKTRIGSNRSSSNSPSSESGSEKNEKGLGHSSSNTSLTDETGGHGRHHNTTSSRSSRRSGKKGNSHSHARAK